MAWIVGIAIYFALSAAFIFFSRAGRIQYEQNKLNARIVISLNFPTLFIAIAFMWLSENIPDLVADLRSVFIGGWRGK